MITLPPRFTPAATDEPLLGLSSKPARVLADAVKYHRAGTLDRAETLYRLLLERAGEHPDVLHCWASSATRPATPAKPWP